MTPYFYLFQFHLYVSHSHCCYISVATEFQLREVLLAIGYCKYIFRVRHTVILGFSFLSFFCNVFKRSENLL